MRKRFFSTLFVSLMTLVLSVGCRGQLEPITDCDTILPPAVLMNVDWTSLTPETMRPWVEENFGDEATNIDSGSVPSAWGTLFQVEWEDAERSYTALFGGGQSLQEIQYYYLLWAQRKGEVQLGDWLECAGGPEAYSAYQQHLNTLENVLVLFYLEEGIIAMGSETDVDDNRIDPELDLWDIKLVQPGLSLEEMLAVDPNQSTNEGSARIRPWEGMEDSLMAFP